LSQWESHEDKGWEKFGMEGGFSVPYALGGGRTVSDGFDSRLLAERRDYFGPLPK